MQALAHPSTHTDRPIPNPRLCYVRHACIAAAQSISPICESSGCSSSCSGGGNGASASFGDVDSAWADGGACVGSVPPLAVIMARASGRRSVARGCAPSCCRWCRRRSVAPAAVDGVAVCAPSAARGGSASSSSLQATAGSLKHLWGQQYLNGSPEAVIHSWMQYLWNACMHSKACTSSPSLAKVSWHIAHTFTAGAGAAVSGAGSRVNGEAGAAGAVVAGGAGAAANRGQIGISTTTPRAARFATAAALFVAIRRCTCATIQIPNPSNLKPACSIQIAKPRQISTPPDRYWISKARVPMALDTIVICM
jgi:hypothetical protein